MSAISGMQYLNIEFDIWLEWRNINNLNMLLV